MKKKQETNYLGWDSFNCLRKTIKIMKISTLLMFIGLCNISATVFPQSSKIDLSLQNVSLKEAFENIEKVSGYKFLYRSDLVNINSVTSIETNGSSLEKLLDKLFTNTEIRYNILNDNLVVLTPMQKPKVTGTVVDAISGEAIPGVNVSIEGTTIGTVTDESGKYSLELPSENSVLIFSFVGYTSQKIAYSGQENISINLSADVKSLDEIVVVGYGVQKRSSVTGAISPISGKELRKLTTSSVSSALQGQAAGVSVVNNGGPGTDPIVRIRGNGSITFAADPLYVIDGTPATSLASFDSRDIESVEVLKDASSTAIYGSRAANGVVLITTKKGKKGEKVRINVESSYGIQNMPKKLDLLNTEQYLQYGTEFLTNGGSALPARFSRMDEPIYEGASTTYRQTNTDWQDELFQTATISDNSVSFSSGGEKSTYYGSVGYYKQKGIMVGTGYERFSARFNSDHDISKVFKFGQTLAISNGDRDNENLVQGRPNIMHMIRMAPYMPNEIPEGAVVDGGTKTAGGYRAVASSIDGQDAFNPVVAQKLYTNTTGTTKVFGTMYLEVKIFDFLKFKTTAGLDYENILTSINNPIFNDGFNSNPVVTIRRDHTENVTKMFSNQLTFDKKMGNHYLNVIAVQEQTPYKSRFITAGGNLATNAVKEISGMTNQNANGTLNENTLLSYLGRINYDFKGRYLLSVSMRADGSSKFAKGKEWGYFPSASIGWRVSEEEFMKSIDQISDLKFRLGYGELGNNGGIGNYDSKATISTNMDYVLNNATAPAGYYNGLDNPFLQWETSKMTNVGIDLGLFNNKFTLTAEYFTKTTDNLILNVPYGRSLGYFAAYRSNIGKMKNWGTEFQASAQINSGEFNSTLSANISFIKNEVEKLATAGGSIEAGSHQDYGGYNITKTEEGRAIQSFYGLETDGLFQSNEEVQNSPKQVVTLKNGVPDYTKSTAAGDIKFKDQNGDGVIDNADRVFLGSYLPKFSYGFSYGGSYKNFDFNLMFQGVYGNKIYNASRVVTEGMIRLFNAGTEVLDAWTPENPNTDIPRAVAGDPNANARTSDRFIEDGSYLRLKALTIGYSIPLKTLQSVSKGTISGLRIYVTGQNLLTFTKYSGLDPEIGTSSAIANNALTNGVDYGMMPQPRTILAGIQLNF